MTPPVENRRILKVASSTDSNQLAGMIIAQFSKPREIPLVLRTIGAGSLNQAVKAAIISNRQFSLKGMKVTLVPSFFDLEDGITSIELEVVPQRI